MTVTLILEDLLTTDDPAELLTALQAYMDTELGAGAVDITSILDELLAEETEEGRAS